MPATEPQSAPDLRPTPDLGRPVLGRGVLLTLAVACGVSVANIYFPQAISPLIASALHTTTASAALVATAAQLGYAVGLFLLVPLGDRLRHRPLVTTLLCLTGLGLAAASAAPALPLLLLASTLIGLTTVVPQVLLPMAAGLANPNQRGAVTGTLLSGLLAGVLLARTFSGTLGQWLGWRAPYVVAAGLVLVLAAVLTRAIPHTEPAATHRYPALLATTVRLLRAEPDLRRSCLYQATMFGGFSAAWTSIALFVSGPVYHLGPATVGVVALVGAGSIVFSPIIGRRIDRTGPELINLVCFVLAIIAAGILVVGRIGGLGGLIVLSGGMLLLDIAVQSGQVANQARIFALAPQFRSRLNTAYMTCAFVGGTLGSWLGIRVYTWLGWPGVCGTVAVLAGLGLARHLLHRAAATASPRCYVRDGALDSNDRR